MSQFYTKDQIDQIATVIGTKVRELKTGNLTPADNYVSFVDALDLAIGSGSQFLYVPNEAVAIESNSEYSPRFSFTVNNGRLHNPDFDTLVEYWGAYKSDQPFPDYLLNIEHYGSGVRFTSNSIEPILVQLKYNSEEFSTTDYEFREGEGTVEIVDGHQVITFSLGPSNQNTGEVLT